MITFRGVELEVEYEEVPMNGGDKTAAEISAIYHKNEDIYSLLSSQLLKELYHHLKSQSE